MVDVNKRLVEVNEVLLQLSEKDMAKIPEKVILNIRNKMDKNYTWNYNPDKELTEQGLLEDTIAILAYINLKYLLNEEQKEFMNKLYRNNERKRQEELQAKYPSDNIFKNNKKEIKKEDIKEVSDLPVEIKKETFFEKIINFIKGLFNKNK